jgi:DNA polymerase III alpha subunit
VFTNLDRIVNLAQKDARIKESGQTSMFEFLTDPGDEIQNSFELDLGPLMTDREKAVWERDLLGISFSDDSFRTLLSSMGPVDGIVSISAVDFANTKEKINFIGQVASVRPGLTKKGQPFAAVEVSLLDGKLRALVWPGVYEKTKDQWEEGNLLRIVGRIRAGSDGLEINCDSATPFFVDSKMHEDSRFGTIEGQSPANDVPQSGLVSPDPFLRLVVHETEDPQYDDGQLREIIKLLLEYEGNNPIYLEMFSGGKKILMEIPYKVAICTDLKNRLVEILGEQAVCAGDSVEKESVMPNPSIA